MHDCVKFYAECNRSVHSMKIKVITVNFIQITSLIPIACSIAPNAFQPYCWMWRETDKVATTPLYPDPTHNHHFMAMNIIKCYLDIGHTHKV